MSAAMAKWRRLREDLEIHWDEYEAAESFILNKTPTSADEAIAILEIVLTQAGDGRSDGLDQRGLGAVRLYLQSLNPHSAVLREAASPTS